VDELPPWYTNRLSRLVKSAKLHMVDTGLACALLGLDGGTLWRDREMYGRMLETFVYQELRRQAGWHPDAIRSFHYRERTMPGWISWWKVPAGASPVWR